MLGILTVFCLLGFGFVGGANGASPMVQGEFMFNTANTADLIGAQVKNPSGEILGSISQVVFDPKGQPAVAVLYQGDLQDRDFARHVAVPFTALEIFGTEPLETSVVLNFPEQEMFSAPRFNEAKDLKSVNDMKWIADVYQYFGQQPYWTEEKSE